MPNNASLSLDTEPTPSRLSDDYTVLIVDDDPDIAPLVDAALRPFHVRTEAISRGRDAVVRIRERRYDLVVLDLGMSDVDGLDILRTLREQSANQNVPVLILTANGSHEALARSFGHGADEFVKKPFDLREFGMRAFRLIRPAPRVSRALGI